MRVGIVLPTRGVVLAPGQPNVALLGDQARRAEALGLDSVWVGDSLVAKPRLEPLSVLAAVAARTTRVGLGTSVLLAALRQPVLLAQQAATVDLISGGRLTLGIGAGGAFNEDQRREWDAAGVDPRTRGHRLTEIVEIMQALWSGEAVTHHGRHFQLDGVRLGFQPKQSRIPILLACHAGEGLQRQYRRAARLADGLISITEAPAEFGRVRQAVLDEALAFGREVSRFAAAFYITVNLNRDVEAARREADAWVRAYYGLNHWGDRWGPFGPPEAIAERARAYADAGADELIFRFASYDQPSQLDLFAREVLPRLR
jgi:alkanesulfonate monooxygenase SsuD/methylene tetrahydromethanopterin reductase-like flavin-dependent oxidoreductase (luciferase family)